ncbi:hypothetical protein [Brucella thiophenivorans]|uniref:Uncharacterized protein n=1 Tax=Brucella thiophenivorans TaxID=571255 RepID=A0A256FE05_9HYPH|nr:hypothetical protein [Brucella thiophenivorans]OYR13085.1 hypothetical protein CEV31_3519 [Brucella thiophenivorans]
MSSPAIHRLRRLFLEQWIDEAIALLDQIDGDADFEDTDEDFVDERENPERMLGGQGA